MRKKLPKLLVTGGAGFIASTFVRKAVEKGYRVVVIDKLTYAGDLTRLRPVKNQITFYKTDIIQAQKIDDIIKKEQPSAILHFAAETHVDRSLLDVSPFIATNIQGTATLIDCARHHRVPRFIHISTDEVYGEIPKGSFTESSLLHPNNPYSSTKAAADFLIHAAVRAHNFPAIIVRPSNNYGPWQYPEKLVPVVLLKALSGQKIPVYGKGLQVREWLHVSDCVEAVLLILTKGRIGENYNVGAQTTKKNIETVRTILSILGKPHSLIQFVKDRPGHDIRYSLNADKIRRLGWEPQISFEEGMKTTAAWAVDHYDWLSDKLKLLQDYWKRVYYPKK
ncbi:MAG TPA: dTDP-glucose 4,6-dehydratase [Candidatus Omnitrophota bacterium]|nr:dTDP-glucose 4,6-dehydratase [Candidatus Omnitrophota bacterium]